MGGEEWMIDGDVGLEGGAVCAAKENHVRPVVIS
jgi:hypothetical protein